MSGGEDFGELVLLIGDFYIPQRKSALPKQFTELLNTDKIRSILCTGNVGSSSVLKMFKNITPDVHIVKGNLDIDEPFCDFPDYEVVEIGLFRIGLIHGHQVVPWGDFDALSEWQRKLNCDILVSGFTHRSSAEKVRGKFYINPGTATGAYKPRALSTTNNDPITPSFMLMSIRGSSAVLYVYDLREGKVNVAMSDFSKEDSAH